VERLLPADFRFEGTEVFIRQDPASGNVPPAAFLMAEFFPVQRPNRRARGFHVGTGRWSAAETRANPKKAVDLLDSNVASSIIKGDMPSCHTAPVENFLLIVTILAWDSAAAKQYGWLRAVLKREGQPMENLDMMIGAHALAAEAVLVTNDRAFARIQNLKVANWTKA
jgi:hypothetical protein